MIDLSSTANQPLPSPGWGVTIDEFGGNVPVQGSGEVSDGATTWYWYFRARGDQWSLEVGPRLDEYGCVPEGEELLMARGVYGPWPEAGYMETEEAAQYLEDALVAFAEGRRGDWEHPVPRGRRSTMMEVLAMTRPRSCDDPPR